MEAIHRNVNFALYDLSELMIENGVKSDSRNGPVLTCDEPFMLTTTHPMERVLLCPERRANPLLFLLDGLSVLSMVDLVKPLADIAPRFRSYSDDGVTLRGHYGRRLRPQIQTAIDMFREQTNTRRVVLQIWDRGADLGAESRDIPCNVMVIPRITAQDVYNQEADEFIPMDHLDLTVVNRSNDLYWGMLGANIVQFSFLQEYMARMLNIRVGRLHQMSTNLHAYTTMGPGRLLAGDPERWENPFSPGSLDYPPVIALDTTNLTTDLDLMFLAMANDDELPSTQNYFLRTVVHPMIECWKAKSAEPLKGLPDCDWFHAARMWWRS